MAKWNLERIAGLTEQPMDPEEACTFCCFMGYRVWWMYSAPYLMDALVSAGNGDPATVAAISPPESTAGEIQVRNETGQPFTLSVQLLYANPGILVGDSRVADR